MMSHVPALQTGSRVETHLEPGRYKHFKGREYDLLAVARDTETEELVVVYRAAYDPEQIWVRPLAMFLEPVNRGGGTVPRFQKVDVPEPRSIVGPPGVSRLAHFVRQLADRSISRIISRQAHDPLNGIAGSALRIGKRDIARHS